jgi:hypothetical protein
MIVVWSRRLKPPQLDQKHTESRAPEGADAEQDDPDRVHVEAVTGHLDCERQNGTNCDQDDR